MLRRATDAEGAWLQEDKITSSFDIAARDAHRVKEMEVKRRGAGSVLGVRISPAADCPHACAQERTRVVREEQKRKKEHQKKVKQQLEEDKMIRKLKPILAKVRTLSADELRMHAEAITAFVAENGRSAGSARMLTSHKHAARLAAPRRRPSSPLACVHTHTRLHAAEHALMLNGGPPHPLTPRSLRAGPARISRTCARRLSPMLKTKPLLAPAPLLPRLR